MHGTYISNLCGGILSAIITVSSCSRNLGINISKKLLRCDHKEHLNVINRLTPNDPYMGRTAPLTSKRCNLYIYSTNICTEYFKHALYFPFSSLQNAVCFIMLTLLVPVLFTFYKEDVLKLKKKNNSGAKGLNMLYTLRFFSLQNAVCFIMLTCLVPVLFTFYIQDVLRLKK